MTEQFSAVRAVVATVERVWAEAIPWAGDARARLAGLAGDEPDGLAQALDAAAEVALGDPLGWSSSVAAAIDAQLASARDELDALRSVRDDWPGQLDAARRLLDELGAAVAGSEDVVARATSRIAGAAPLATGDPCHRLAAELDAVAESAGTAAVARCRRRARPRGDAAARDALADVHASAAVHQSAARRARRAARPSRRLRGQGGPAGPPRGHRVGGVAPAGARGVAHGTDRSASCRGPRASLPGSAESEGPAVTVAERCRRTDCAGSIEDGYCDDCGLAPDAIGRSPTQINGTAAPGRAATARSAPSRGTMTVAQGRLGAGMVDIPPVPARDPETAVMTDPTVAEHRRFCARCDEPVGRSRDGQPGRTEGFCASLRSAVLVPRLARSRRPRRRPVRGRRLPRPRRTGLDLPGTRPLRVRALGRPEGAPRPQRRARHGRRPGRAPLPRRGRAPQHRQDPQLRRAPRRRLHRDGVRRRREPQADAGRPPAHQRRPARSAAGRPGHRLLPRGAAGPRPPPRPRAGLSATSSRTT